MKLTIDKASIVVDQALAHGYNPSSGASADKDENLCDRRHQGRGMEYQI